MSDDQEGGREAAFFVIPHGGMSRVRRAFGPGLGGTLSPPGVRPPGGGSGEKEAAMEPISIVAGAVLLIAGAAFAVFLGVSSDRNEAGRPH